MSRRHLLACLACLLVAASAQAQVPLYQPFDLAVGASIEIVPGGLLLVFDGVGEDSRCPIDVVCVWEGDAAVDLRATLPGEETVVFQVHTSGLIGNPFHDVGEFRVMLLAVLPAPSVAAGPIDPDDYVVQMMVVSSDVVQREAVAWGALKARYD